MKKMIYKCSLTVLFESPFWIGLYERTEGGKYQVCKITFGAEPKDYDIYNFLLDNWHKLKFSPPVTVSKAAERRVSPKRRQREINKQLQVREIGTKAQNALKLQHEQLKTERKVRTREEKALEKERQFSLRQEKKKAKHKGR